MDIFTLGILGALGLAILVGYAVLEWIGERDRERFLKQVQERSKRGVL